MISCNQCSNVEGDLRNTLNVVSTSVMFLRGVEILPSVALHENKAESCRRPVETLCTHY